MAVRIGGARLRRAELPHEGAGDLAGAAPDEQRGVRVGGVHEDLGLGDPSPADLPGEVRRDDEGAPRPPRGQRARRRGGGRQGDDPERERAAEGVRVLAGERRLVQVLDHQRDVGHRERDRRAEQRGEADGQHQCEGQGEPIPDELRQVLSRLGDDAAHGRNAAAGQAAARSSARRLFSTMARKTSSSE